MDEQHVKYVIIHKFTLYLIVTLSLGNEYRGPMSKNGVCRGTNGYWVDIEVQYGTTETVNV